MAPVLSIGSVGQEAVMVMEQAPMPDWAQRTMKTHAPKLSSD